MLRQVSTLVDELRQPEYTGSNRCLPCTVINVLIAVAVSVVIALTISIGVGAGVFAICAIAIYLRGYLIPGTPTFTKRYLPERVHRLFGTHHVELPAVGDSTTASNGNSDPPGVESDGAYSETNAGEVLLAEQVVAECPDTDDLCLDSTFRDAWRARIDGIRKHGTGVERLAAHLAIDPRDLALEDREGEYAVIYQDDRIDAWPSRAAFLADMAVEPTLSEWFSDWDEFDPAIRTRVIASLRAFLEQCPACDAELETAESAWETCCREGTDVTVTCGNCGDVVFTGRY